jgi:IclR family mhp operon transcriptional activator
MSLMGIRSVERALRVLQEMNLQPYTSVARLHSRTGLPKPTLVRILKTLEEQGYVENDPRLGGYQVSALVSSLSSGFHKEPMVVEAGRPWAITITRQHQWPVSISLLDRDAVVVRFSTVQANSTAIRLASLSLTGTRMDLKARGDSLLFTFRS